MLDEIQAAVLDIKLKYIDTENKIRRTIAKHFINSITNPEIILPNTLKMKKNMYGTSLL